MTPFASALHTVELELSTASIAMMAVGNGRKPRFEEASMEGYYTAYLLGSDGGIAGQVDLVCENEQVAREHAQKLAIDSAVELWHGATRIAKFHPRLN